MLNGEVMSVIFIVGGARSGKSTFAETKAKEYSEKVLYIATAVITDEAMADRVKRHTAQRPGTWDTLEMYRNFETLVDKAEFTKAEVVLLDCITTLIGNFMVDSKLNFDTCSLEEVDKLENMIDKLEKGKLNIGNKAIAKTTSKIVRHEYNTIAYIMILDKPDITWTNSDAESLYNQMSEFFELNDRYIILKEKTDILNSIIKGFSSISHSIRGLFVEWVIVILILVEVVLMVLDLLK